jgi:VanZ family protein
MKHRARLWGPSVLWAAAIFAASSRSDTGAVGRIPDWLTHGLAYAILSVLLSRALAGGLGAPLNWRSAALAVGLATLYGVSDEYHQSFVPGRDPSAADVAKDLLGAAAGAAAFGYGSSRREHAERDRSRADGNEARDESPHSAFPSPHVGSDRVGGR